MIRVILLALLFLGFTTIFNPAVSLDTFEKVEYTDEEITWLAKNVYFEARNQGTAGRLAVVMVTLNRVFDDRFPNNIKQVVLQSVTRPSWKDPNEMIPVKHKCQFSWYCDGKKDIIDDWETFGEIKRLVLTYLTFGSRIDITDGATHYHADYVNPSWAETKTKTIEIEDHIFYRWEKV